MAFTAPLPFLLVHATDTVIEVRETPTTITLSFDNQLEVHDKYPIRSLLLENCENCVIQIYTKLVNVRLVGCENCTVIVRAPIVRSVEVLFSCMVIVKLERDVPLIQIEDCFYATVAQCGALSSYYLAGANQTIAIAHLRDNRLTYEVIYDMILTDTVIDMMPGRIERSRLVNLMRVA
jgi:hypothetical protein